MISLKLDSNRKLTLNASGNLATVSGLAAIVQNCETAMRTQLGEMYYNADEGIPTRDTLWDRYNPTQFIAAGRLRLAGVEGVTKVLTFTAEKSGNIFTYTAKIETVYGLGVVTNG